MRDFVSNEEIIQEARRRLDQGAWDEGFRLTLPVFFKGSTIPKAGWDYLLKLQAATSNKDYSKASYEKILIPEAQVR